ncbi:plasmid recombination protein [Vibrio diabolicus]|uniref:plasmid recombination protein n=1 Tax=Vibrio diabolicus TaxID=50719 RepID=UPI003B5B48BD
MYQFLHYETYALNATKSSKSFISVAKEFMRDPSAIPHVSDPKPPQLLYGVDAYEVERVARERACKAKDAIGRKLRKDAQVVLSAVASAPSSLPEEELKKWIEQTIFWFKDKYGENFISAILHRDEAHPHLHLCIVLPDSQENGMANLKYIHAPLAARQDTQGGAKSKSRCLQKSISPNSRRLPYRSIIKIWNVTTWST